MLPIAYYFLQVVLCSGLLIGYYLLVLRNKRFHQYNRFFLLAAALLSWIVPLIKIRWSHPVISEDPQMIRLLAVVADNNSQIEANLTHAGFQWSWSLLATGIYFLVATVLFTGMLLALYKVYRLLKHHSCKKVDDVYLILTRAKGTPFSFFRYIFWNEEIDLGSPSGKQILQHELTHVRQKHSVDKICIQVMLVAGWFNPFFWLLKREMEMIHEFIADKKAVDNGDTASLAQMLLTAAYPQQQFLLTNPFFFSPIRRRLKMLTNHTHPRFSYMRRVIVLPLLAVVVILFSFRNKEQRENLTLSVASVVEKVVDVVSKEIDQKVAVATVTPIMDTSSGTENEKPGADLPTLSLRPVAETIKQDTMIVKRDTINIIATGIQNGAGIRSDTVRSLKLNFDERYRIFPQSNTGGSIFGRAIPANALIMLDGKPSDSSTIDNLDPAEIEYGYVYMKHLAAILYGDAGKNGAVLVATKKYALEKRSMILVDGVRFNPSKDSLNPDKISSVRFKKGDNDSMMPKELKKDLLQRIVVTGYPIQVETYPKQVDKVPEFPGGLAAWTKFLEQNLDKDIVKKNGGPPGKYTVVVSLSIDAEGIVKRVSALNDPGYGAQYAARLLFENCPKWIPAVWNNRSVAYRHNVSISFFVPDLAAKLDTQGRTEPK